MTVLEYLKADRQWPRHLRVAHATMQLINSKTRGDEVFWSAVLKANDKKSNS